MTKLIQVGIICFLFFLAGCSTSRKPSAGRTSDMTIRSRVEIKENVPAVVINTKNVSADDVVVFAESLQGVPYKYGSTDIKKGFDCSGFISYVFNHFKIIVPRTSVNFTNAGKEVSIKESRRGDLILFTGSDVTSRKVGHMGIITENNNRRINFVHSASGNARGVMISGMSEYFVTRFVKVIRLFDDL